MIVRLFKPQFAQAVRTGQKLTTIRPEPYRYPKVGDTISLRAWTGAPYRSKQEQLAMGTIAQVGRIAVGPDWITLDGYELPADEVQRMAIADGFSSMTELAAWFTKTHGALPFVGIFIRWVLQPEGAKPGELL